MRIGNVGCLLGAWMVALALAGCGGGGSDGPAAGDVVLAEVYAAPAAITADSQRVIHWMTGADGRMTKATALLFVPKGTAPAGGWPLVSWVHGTTTVGSGSPAGATCSASESVTLDGGLTADGFASHYIETIAALVGAGYAVVAPDLEGLGAEAQRNGTPHAYYNLASSGRAVGAAVIAAHQAAANLSNDWAAVGHSEGGHVVLALESTAAEASGYDYKGAVAFAPFNSIEASVDLIDTFAAADPANLSAYRTQQQLFVGMMATALSNQQPGFEPSQVMGADLLALMPQYKSECIFALLGIVGQDVADKTPAAYQGFSPTWADDPAMKAFLQANDSAVASGFTIAKPTLVLQGTADPFVFEALQTPLIDQWQTAGMPITYKTFTGADHSTIMTQGSADMLAFLKTLMP